MGPGGTVFEVISRGCCRVTIKMPYRLFLESEVLASLGIESLFLHSCLESVGLVKSVAPHKS